ncbi:MAG: hypothetical protein EOO67_03275 [Microbacterium sp.]|nr:MAG: hypothetical protein EOO67_03275 [Microbacterium sp.]
MDDAGDGGRVVEAVGRERLLPARDAREDRDAEVCIAQRGGRERGLVGDSLHRRPRPRRNRVVGVEHAPDDASAGIHDFGIPDRIGEGDTCVCAGQQVSLSCPRSLRCLHGRDFAHIPCEGGPTLLGAILAAEPVDEVCLTITPRLLAVAAPPIVAADVMDVGLELVSLHESEGTLLGRWIVQKTAPTRGCRRATASTARRRRDQPTGRGQFRG